MLTNGEQVGVRFCTLKSGPSVAWAARGDGPPLVLVPGWLCHLHEIWSHPAALRTGLKFASGHRFVWYDRLGCGLSDREGFEASLENDVEQLAAVLDAAGVERASLIGYSFGGPAAILFATRYPERVDKLVLYSTFCLGTSLASWERFAALEAIVRADWGLGSRMFSAMFLPNGSAKDIRWFSQFQRKAATSESAIRLLEFIWSIDVRPILADVSRPTLVAHNRRDPAVPLDCARTLAALIPGAKLTLLDGNEHDPFIRDSGALIESILAFIEDREMVNAEPLRGAVAELTAREREVLSLLARGESNKAIASRLGIQLATVERHVANIYEKIGARGRADAAMHAVAIGLVPVPG